MKPSSELFFLIKSMTKSEKRFFKLSSSLQSGDKNYLKIFDIIDKQTAYVEDDLKFTFKNETFIKHLPSEKNHLYKLILKSLRSYHADNSVSSLLKQELKNVEILYQKALYKECNKFLSRAKKIAIENEKFYFLFECITWEKTLLEEAFESGEFANDLDALVAEETDVIEKLRNLAEYHVLYSKINYVFRQNGFARNEEQKTLVKEIANHHLIKGKNTALSNRAATICYYIQGLCHVTNREHDLAFTKFLKVKAIFDNHPAIKKDLAKRYLRTINHLLYSYLDNNMFSKANLVIETLRKMSNLPGFDSMDLKVHVFVATYNAELLICDKQGDYEKAINLVSPIIVGLKEFENKINKEQEIIFYYNIAYIYFGAGQYRNALQWINKLLNDNEQELRQDIYSFARIINLVIHFELGNIDLLEYLIKSSSRFLGKRQKDYMAESIIIKHMKKLSKLVYNEDIIAYLSNMKTELKALFKDYNESVVLDYFDIITWLDAKIKNISYAEAVRDKNKKLLENNAD